MKQSNTYTISQERLRSIVKQEIEGVLRDLEHGGFEKKATLLQDVNPYHKGPGAGGGQFTSKKRGKIYSVTGNARDNVKNIPVGRGTNKDGKPVALFGVNSGSPDKQCGRMTIDGDKKKKTRRCYKYPKKYWDQVDEDVDIRTGLPVRDDQARKNRSKQARRDALGVMPKDLDALSRGVYQEGRETWVATSTLRKLFEATQGQPGASTDAARKQMAAKCRSMGFRTFEELLQAMNAMKKATEGKLDGEGK